MKSKIFRIQNIYDIIRLGWLLFFRDFQYRYRLSYFGYIWAFIRPVAIALPIIFVGKKFNFGQNNEPGVSYEAFAFLGVIFFQIFFDSVTYPQMLIRRVRSILKKIAFPYLSIILASSFYVLFNLSVYIILLVITLFIFNISIHFSIVLSFLCLPLLIIAGLSIGIFISPITLLYLDIRYSLSIISGILLWTTPVVYALPKEGFLRSVNLWNPLTYLINTPRFWIIGGIDTGAWFFAISIIFFSLLFLGGLKYYFRAMPIVIEKIL